MTTFTTGSNRERVYKVLTDKPRTPYDISTVTGLKLEAVKSVLDQIRVIGHSKKEKLSDGSTAWIKGDGKPLGKKVVKKGKNPGIGKKVKQYIKDRVGKIVTVEDVVSKLNLTSPTFPYKIISDYAKEGHLTVVGDDKPYGWRVNPSINDPKQSEMIPSKSTPPRGFASSPMHIPPAILPNDAPMHSSAALSALMQTEYQLDMYKNAFKQVLVVYEHLGNVLETVGLLED